MGKLVYLVGASGSGKDSVLRMVADENLANVYIATRYVTREDNSNENHYCLSPTAFLQRQQAGKFAMSWQANGLWYGIDYSIDTELAQGNHVILNGSRHYLSDALRIYPNISPVCLMVAPHILQQRLQQRGRESDAEIMQRMQRNTQLAKHLPENTFFLNNDGDLRETVQDFIHWLLCDEKNKAETI